jgi:hydrogenase maturation protein HypF
MLREILADIKEALGPEGALTDETRRAAARFMNTLVMMAAEMAGLISRDTGIRKVVLSGGSFQNMYVLERLVRQLREKGLEPFTHSRVSCNDEGLSLGQLMIARRQL